MVKYIYHNPSLSMPVESYCGALYSDLVHNTRICSQTG